MKHLKINKLNKKQMQQFNRYFNLTIYKQFKNVEKYEPTDDLKFKINLKLGREYSQYHSYDFYNLFISDLQMLTNAIDLYHYLKNNIYELIFIYNIIIMAKSNLHNLMFYIYPDLTETKIVLYKGSWLVYTGVYTLETNLVNEIKNLIKQYK